MSVSRGTGLRALPLIAFLAFATATSALAAEERTPAPLDAVFHEATELYRNHEYEKAIVLLQRAVRDDARAPALRAQARVLLALCHVQVFDEESATAQLEAALGDDPNVTLPDDAPPVARQLFQRATKKLAEARRDNDGGAAGEDGEDGSAPGSFAWQTPASFVMFGVSAVAVVGSIVSFVAASANASVAVDPDAFQAQAQAAADAANVEIGLGLGLLGVGVASVGTGVAFLAMAGAPVETVAASEPATQTASGGK